LSVPVISTEGRNLVVSSCSDRQDFSLRSK
jgi:hypothetical protein